MKWRWVRIRECIYEFLFDSFDQMLFECGEKKGRRKTPGKLLQASHTAISDNHKECAIRSDLVLSFKVLIFNLKYMLRCHTNTTPQRKTH